MMMFPPSNLKSPDRISGEPAKKRSIYRRIMVRRLLLLGVAEKTALSDDRSHLRWHHFIPALVPARDALEHVTRKDRQIFRVEIIELDEAASAHQVIVEKLQLGVHLKRTNSL